MSELFTKHRAMLTGARAAVLTREYWSAYSEAPGASVYGADAKRVALEEFDRLRQQRFDIPGHPDSRWTGEELSPFGGALGISYPTASVDELIQCSSASAQQWAGASPEQRTGIALEMLEQLNSQSHLIGQACSMTTGQPFAMAFQAGGPHAQERGLEAIAYAYEEMARVPKVARWVKPQGKGPPVEVEKSFTLVPRGISLAIACGTFPTWNSYPGMFASLVTGNTLIVKPNPSSVLPLALTVRTLRAVLREQGCNPNVVLLAVDDTAIPIAATLAMRPEVRLIDYTGGASFGQWLRAHACHAQVFTEEAGVNSIVIDSTDDFQGMCRNIALSLSLYSGQMCTAPQNLLIPRDGIQTEAGRKSFQQVAGGICDAVQGMLAEKSRAQAILGAIQSEETLARIARVAAEGPVLLPSRPIALPDFPAARTATPLIRCAHSTETRYFMQEQFGPISYVIATDSTRQSLEFAGLAARSKGAISMGVYTTQNEVSSTCRQLAAEVGVTLSCNLTSTSLFVNQNAAFSDYHVSGANPAGTACITDSAFVASRFRVGEARTLSATRD